MATQKPPHDYSQELYEKYKETFEDYIKSTVLLLNKFSIYIMANVYSS